MNNQNVNEQFPDELDQAIRSLASVEVPSDAVQRLIHDATKHADFEEKAAKERWLAKKQFYLLLACGLVAFLTPLTVRALRTQLNFLPGFEQPAFRGAFAGLASICAFFLTWSIGQHYITGGSQIKRPASKTHWAAQLTTLILFGWFISGFFTSQGNLYAQMQQNLARIKTIQYVMTVKDADSNELLSTTRAFIQEPKLMRFEQEDDALFSNVMIMDLGKRKCLTLDNLAMTAEFLPLYQIREMEEELGKTINFLRTVDANAKPVGESTVGDRLCETYEVRDEGTTSTISIDKVTKLPLQMRIVFDELKQFESIVSQFEFDQSLNPDLFSMDVPDEYATSEVERKKAVDDSDLDFVLGESFGAATFGMTVDQVVEALGEPDKTSEFDDTIFMADEAVTIFKVCTLNYDSRGFELRVEKEQGLIGVTTLGMFGGPRPFQGTIAGTLRIGDSSDSVKEQMGKPSRKANLQKGESPGDLIYELPNGSTIRFAFEDSKLAMVNNAVDVNQE